MVKVRDIVGSALDRRRLVRSPSDAGEPFEVDCPCGTSLSGFRRRKYASLNCPHCGEEVYVLPLNPRRPPKPKLRQKDATWPPVASSPPREAEPARRVTIDPPREPAAQPPTDPLGRVRHHLYLRARVVWESLVTRCKQIRPPRFSRLQLTVGAVALLVLGTAAWQWDRFRQRQFAKDLVEHSALGIESFAEGEFGTAHQHLRRADRAARGLRGDSHRQRLAKQLSREADIWSSMALGSIHRLTAGSVDGAPVDPTEWPERFYERFMGRSLVFDALVTRVLLYSTELDVEEDSLDPEMLESDLPVAVPTGLHLEWSAVGPEARIEVLLPDVEEFSSVEIGSPQRFLFGARLAGLQPSADEPGLWFLLLEPESCTLLTLPEPLEQMGWPDVENLRSLLAAQAETLGVEH